MATKLAHDFPDRVGSLVLINSVGAGVWARTGDTVKSLAERPLWDWAFNFPKDIAMAKGAVSTVAAILEDAVPNFVTNPFGLWKAATIARTADLSAELADLKAEGVPVFVIWGEGDTIIPRACYDATCEVSGATGYLVPGRHSWLLADPDAFALAMVRAVTSAMAARTARAGLVGNRWRRQLSALPTAVAG